MASTETRGSNDPPSARHVVRAIDYDDLAHCLALSEAAGWNQIDADWRLMFEIGRGWGIEAIDGHTLVASIMVLPFEPATAVTPAFAWISMVLVLPEFRRQGLATALLSHVTDWLIATGVQPVLDATPAGEPVYGRAGFSAGLGFSRYRRAHVAQALVPPQSTATPADRSDADRCQIRPLVTEDWPHVLRSDAHAFGARREAVLRDLARRMPTSALVADRNGTIEGFVFGRDGREAAQIGPLWAADDHVAMRLLDRAIASHEGPLILDLMDHRSALVDAIRARGFVQQRSFRRMVLPTPHEATIGDPRSLVLVAGPELG